MPDSTPSSRRDLVLLFCAAGLIALTVFPLLMPAHDFDRGIFVSVAERLLAGDRLYAEVWDNKGPLFYYLVVLERLAGSAGEILFEVFLVALSSYSTFRLVAVFSTFRDAVLAGFIATPIILTSVYYFPGYTHLPAITLSFAALALVAAGRGVWGGFVLGLVAFANILVAPVAFSSALALCWPKPAFYVRIALGVVLSVSLAIAFLFIRGEVRPFLDAVVQNFAYSQGSLVKGHGLAGRLLSHLSLINFDRAKIIAVAICACLLYARFKANAANATLFTVAVTALCASAAVLVTTGLWRQHLQLLSVPAILSVSALLAGGLTLRTPSRLALVILISWILSGGSGPARYIEAARRLGANWKALNATPQDAMAIMSNSSPSTYARLGKNDDGGHAIGLAQWKLGCARFHQYPFDTNENLKNTLDCAAGVETILVTPSFAPEQDQPGWNRFVANGERLLSTRFHCQHQGALRVCRRLSPGA
jgi:hypothetical protein